MINNPPRTENLALNTWMQSVQIQSNNTLKSIFFPVSPLGTGAAALKGKHSSMNLTVAAQTAYMEAVIPHKIREFKEAGIRVIPTTTGTINYTVNFQYGAIGAAYNASSKTASYTGKVVTDTFITELDLPVTTYFTDLAANDQLAVEFILDGLTTTTEVRVLGLYLKFI